VSKVKPTLISILAIGLLAGSAVGVAAQDESADPMAPAYVTGTVADRSGGSRGTTTSADGFTRIDDYESTNLREASDPRLAIPSTASASTQNSDSARKPANPSAHIAGPSNDLRFRYVLNNRKSERTVTFRINPWSQKVTVPAGCIFRIAWHREPRNTRLAIRRGNGEVLARRNSGPSGNHGPRWTGYDKGMSCSK
jgi:hypothetical protein